MCLTSAFCRPPEDQVSRVIIQQLAQALSIAIDLNNIMIKEKIRMNQDLRKRSWVEVLTSWKTSF